MSRDFPPTFHLRSKADFKSLRGGRRLHADGLCIVSSPNTFHHARLGMAVSRKYGNAIQRNRLKRRLREQFRQHAIRDLSVDLLIYPTTDAATAMTPDQVNQAFDRVIKKCGLVASGTP